MTKFKDSKLGYKIDGERLRRKEITRLLQRLDELNDELDTKPKEERVTAINAECEFIVRRLKELKALKDDAKFEKIDPNVIIKTVGLGGIAFLISMIELPGNLVNLRALKIAEPVIKLLKF